MWTSQSRPSPLMSWYAVTSTHLAKGQGVRPGSVPAAEKKTDRVLRATYVWPSTSSQWVIT
jgi:hypothetical protein